MAFGQVGSASFDGSSGASSVTLDKPTGVASGDLLICIIVYRAVETPTSVPSGWAQPDGDGIIFLDPSEPEYTYCTYYKVAGSSEPSDYTWEWTDSVKCKAMLVAFRDGFSTTDPIADVGNSYYDQENTTIRAAGVSVASDAPVIFLCAAYSTSTMTVTQPTNFTEVDEDWDSAADFVVEIAYRVWPSAGSTGDQDGTLSASTLPYRKHGFLVALNTPSQTVLPSGIASTVVVGSPTIARGAVTVSPSGIASTVVVGSPTIARGAVTVSPSGVASKEALGSPTVTSTVTVSPEGIPSGEAFGQPFVSVGLAIYPVGIASEEALGEPTLLPGPVTIQPEGISSAEALGEPIVTNVRVTATPPERDLLIVLDASGDPVGVLPAQVKWTNKLLNTDTLDDVTIPWEYTKPDGETISRWEDVETGWQCLWKGHRYVIEDPDTDNETGIQFTAKSAEVELGNFDTNYSPGPATYLNMLPSEIYDCLLSGRAGRAVRNPGFGILDMNGLPTNWSHPAGWTSELVENRRVWQADAGSDESYSDDIPCTPGVSYRIKADIKAAGTTGTRGIKFRWIKPDGSTVDSSVTNLADEDGYFHSVETADIVALGTRLRIVLVTASTAHVTQFDDVRLYEIGPDTGWTRVGTAMDAREAQIPFGDGAIQRYGVWAEGGGATYIESTAVGDYIARVFNGSFVTINYAAGGAGARAKIRLNGVIYEASLDVSSAGSYTINGLDPTNDHIVEVEVAAVKVRFSGLTVSTENRISMRWDFKTVYEAIASLREAVGGEIDFDTIARTVEHKAAIGRDLKANNVVEFRRGLNIAKLRKIQDRSKLINRLTGLGYGEGLYQLVTTVDATDVNDDGNTSIEVYGVQRGKYTDKECKSLATMTTTLERLVAQSQWYRNAYEVDVTDEAAALCVPGDTGHFVYKAINESLRILEITRSTESNTAQFKVANITEDLTQKLEASRKDLATLQKSYQGVPALHNLPINGDFDYDYPVECQFFIPYGADLLDLTLRYQVGGMRATATAVGGGGGTNTPSGGGSTSGSGGSTTPTSSSVSTPSGGGATSGSGGGETSSAGGSSVRVVPGVQRNGSTYDTWYEIKLYPTGAATLELITLTLGNFAGGTRSFSWEVRTAAGGGGSAIDSGSFSNLANTDHISVDVTTTSYPTSNLWARVKQTTNDTCNLLFIAARTGRSNHTHTTTDHTHTTPDHTHPAHSHTVTIGDHTHSTPAHQHALPDHAHTLSYGIHESSAPATVRVYLDDVLVTELNDALYVSGFDLLPYIPKDSNGRVREGYHTVKVATATEAATGRVAGVVFAKQFLATEAA